MDGCIQLSLWENDGSNCSQRDWFDCCAEGQSMVNGRQEVEVEE